jgi:hypothetical protein
MHMRICRTLGFVGCAIVTAVGCSEDPTSPPYTPTLPTAWAAAVTNSYFPLVPGTTYEYRAQTDEGVETVVVEVLAQTRIVNGVTAVVVRDRVSINGTVVEDTYDWFAQDAAGNVWYLGEDSKEIRNGQVVSTEGSWEWGKQGALPGIIMWADPAAHVGENYRQEYFRGEAEDWARVVAVNQSVTVPYGAFSGCIKTEDWNGLERGGRETKYYCPTLGTTLEVGGDERVELVRVTRN